MRNFFIFLILFTFAPQVFAQKFQTRIDSLIKETIKRHQIPGLAVGVVKNGKVIYAEGFGTTKLNGGEPITTNSVFNLASITKNFTATAVMQLVERGKINLDASVTEYLPYFNLKDERYKQITIRHLLTHTSGLEFIEENPFERKAGYDAVALERHIRELSNLTLSSAPGEKYEYSNEGYDILGDIIAKVSKTSYEEYIKRNILEPLRMKNSTVAVSETIPPRYFSDEAGKITVNEKVPFNRAFAPSSALDSNLDDMNRWMLACLNRGILDGKRILKSSSYDEMWKFPVEASEAGKEFPIFGKMGGGWFRWNYDNHQIVGHGGAELGFNSFIALAPNDSVGVIVLGNLYPAKVNYSSTGTYYTADIAKEVMDLLLNIGTGTLVTKVADEQSLKDLTQNASINFDYLKVNKNTVESTHQARYVLKIDKSFKFLGEFRHQPVYEDKQFNVSLAAFSKKDDFIFVHAETHTDKSGGLDYSSLKPDELNGIKFTSKEECVTSAEIPEPYVNPELRFVRDKGFNIVLPLFLKQYFTTSPDGTAEIVLTYGKQVSSCDEKTITMELKAKANKEFRSVIKIAEGK